MGEITEHLAQRQSEDARVRGHKTDGRPPTFVGTVELRPEIAAQTGPPVVGSFSGTNEWP